MRKVFLFMMITLDGYHEGVDHDISWHNARSDEFQDFAATQLDTADTLVFGRRTYDMMASFWPSEQGTEADPETAQRMNDNRKVVFTHSPLTNEWQNVEASDDITETMNRLKAEEGKDIAVLGSNDLCVSLLREGLLDEIRIMINPVVIGRGTPLFASIDRHNFTRTGIRTFDDGNVLLTYTTTH
jgi:dihydrofolate reductase